MVCHVVPIIPAKFQFLIGRLKTINELIRIVPFMSFQFLIGRLKTISNAHDIRLLEKVSIPYRQAKNASCRVTAFVLLLFQFLIGRLKTGWLHCTPFLAIKFQFLIGRLKTAQFQALSALLLQFQFLIGRLKTDISTISPTCSSGFNSLQVG